MDSTREALAMIEGLPFFTLNDFSIIIFILGLLCFLYRLSLRSEIDELDLSNPDAKWLDETIKKLPREVVQWFGKNVIIGWAKEDVNVNIATKSDIPFAQPLIIVLTKDTIRSRNKFVVYHEIAHCYLNHCGFSFKTTQEKEYEASKLAYEWF